MLINTTKTKVMLITTPQRRFYLNNYNPQLTYNNEQLSVVACEKILGVFIDNNLTWANHTNAVAKKIISNLWLLSRIKTYLSTHQRAQFYNPMFNLILIIAMPSGEELLKEILKGSTDCKKEHVKSF